MIDGQRANVCWLAWDKVGAQVVIRYGDLWVGNAGRGSPGPGDPDDPVGSDLETG